MIKLTPSSALAYDDCPRAYEYQYVRRVRSVIEPINLIFGRIVHEVAVSSIQAWLVRQPYDAAGAFEARWSQAVGSTAVEYPSTWSEGELRATGVHLVTQFAEIWPTLGYTPVLDTSGQPLMERTIEVPITQDLVLRGKPDLVVYDRDLRSLVLDLKTPSTAPDPEFSRVADQLTAYQILLEANAAQFGLEGVQALGFLPLIKRKIPKKGNGKGPEVLHPVLTPARTEAELESFQEKLLWIAEDIQRQRFPRRSRMEHNAPCRMCQFRSHCWSGNGEDLVFPGQARQEALAV